MIELALHILDIAENSLRAGATLVEIEVIEDLARDRLSIMVRDNGHGMSPEELERALDPFYTTKKVRRIGLGLPMLKQAAHNAQGRFSLESEPGRGTVVRAEFRHSHIDRQPLGDIAGVVTMLILGSPGIDFVYRHSKDGREYVLDTRENREGLGQVPLNCMEVLNLIRDNISEGLEELNG